MGSFFGTGIFSVKNEILNEHKPWTRMPQITQKIGPWIKVIYILVSKNFLPVGIFNALMIYNSILTWKIKIYISNSPWNLSNECKYIFPANKLRVRNYFFLFGKADFSLNDSMMHWVTQFLSNLTHFNFWQLTLVTLAPTQHELFKTILIQTKEKLQIFLKGLLCTKLLLSKPNNLCKFLF